VAEKLNELRGVLKKEIDGLNKRLTLAELENGALKSENAALQRSIATLSQGFRRDSEPPRKLRPQAWASPRNPSRKYGLSPTVRDCQPRSSARQAHQIRTTEPPHDVAKI
jgi:hypothetical protein